MTLELEVEAEGNARPSPPRERSTRESDIFTKQCIRLTIQCHMARCFYFVVGDFSIQSSIASSFPSHVAADHCPKDGSSGFMTVHRSRRARASPTLTSSRRVIKCPFQDMKLSEKEPDKVVILSCVGVVKLVRNGASVPAAVFELLNDLGTWKQTNRLIASCRRDKHHRNIEISQYCPGIVNS